MSSMVGNILKISIFGESHAKAIGLTIDGLPAGIKIDEEKIKEDLLKRNPKDEYSTKRHEEDKVNFLCGVFNGVTTGAPITFIIENNDVDSSSYSKGEIRPSHADLANHEKYNGFNDYRGGGFSSGRTTASLVVLGSICKEILAQKGIKIGTHIKSIHGVFDEEFDLKNIENQLENINNSLFPVISEDAKHKMTEQIKIARENADSVGGILESVVLGLPVGLGEPYFDSLESYISQLLFSIGGVKAVEFGDGVEFASKLGSEVNDQLQYEGENIKYLSNHNGGINGGISNGQPVVIKTTVKPTPSIGVAQQSINVETNKNINLLINGRHDPCIVQRVRAVVDALLAYAIVDMLMVKESKNI